MNATNQAPAADDGTNPTSQGRLLHASSGRALYLRYRMTCVAIRFWRGVREFADARYDKHLENGRQMNRRLTVRASYSEVVSR